MPLDRLPAPGRALTWIGPAFELAQVGDRGVFVDFDGSLNSFVVDFGPGKVFCCVPTDVRVEPVIIGEHSRRHNAE